MSIDPLTEISTRVTPQSAPVPGRADMIANHAGGFGFEVDDWTRLMRFLVLGTSGGTYYVKQKDLTRENSELVLRLATNHGERLVATLIEVSESARAPKQNPTLFALAIACASPDAATRKAALKAIPRICRIGTHLFIFARYVEQFRGWGRGLRRAISDWYLTPPIEDVAYQAIKYRQREGWSNRDLLRLAHPRSDYERGRLFDWIVRPDAHIPFVDSVRMLPRYVEGYIKANEKGADYAAMVREYRLPWEALPDEALGEAATWEALLDTGMGLTALIRNLNRLTNLGIIAPLSSHLGGIAQRISDPEGLRKARVHPMQVLDALVTYQSGRGARSGSTWTPVSQIVDALDAGFYAAFGTVTPANKNTLLCLDVSSSMTWYPCAGSAVLTPRTGSAAMALITAATEPNWGVMGFSDVLRSITISPRMRLDGVVRAIENVPAGGTDCSLPMRWAMNNKVPVETFAVFTDNETWAGRIHPYQALRQYRDAMGIDAKLVVVGMTATEVSIADPSDAGMMDVCGFDTAAPGLISSFSRGEL